MTTTPAWVLDYFTPESLTTCPTCGSPAADWPSKNCDSPEAHSSAVYICDCGDTVTMADALGTGTRKHRRCHLIDTDRGAVNLGSITAAFLLSLIGSVLFLLAVMGGRHVMCSAYAHRTDGPSYCTAGGTR